MNSEALVQKYKTGELSPEVLVPRLGDLLIEEGYITRDDLKQALTHQRNMKASGKSVLVGQALIDLGMVNRGQLDKMVTQQIAQLQDALQNSNKDLERRVQERTRELQDALDRLTEMNRLKTDFISNMSHELRTPLAHMVGYIDLMADETLGPLTEEQDQAVKVLRKSYRRLSSHIDNLLFLSFDTEGAMNLQVEATPLQTMIPKVLQEAQDKAVENNVELSKSMPADLPDALIDPDKCEWALTQLVDNAIKFNKPGGKVHISAERDGRRVLIAVADTGIGIPKDRIVEIFEPFFQLDSSSTRKYDGAGLGLTLAKRIIEAHGSKVNLESHVNSGTRIAFSLPLNEIR